MPSEPPLSELPATWKFDYPIFHAETRAQWRTWLLEQHETTRGVWLCSWRTGTGRPRCPYPEAVEEALCVGWVDSTTVVFDEDRGLQLYTPRRARSQWTRLNRQRVADMEQQGLMTDAGRRAVAAAQANGWWTIFEPVEDLVEPPALTAALDAEPSARTHWDTFPPSARKQMLWWIISAARESTRAERIAQIVAAAAEGRRARG